MKLKKTMTKEDFYTSLYAHKGKEASQQLIHQFDRFVNTLAVSEETLEYIQTVVARYHHIEGGLIRIYIKLKNNTELNITLFPNGHTIMSQQDND